MSFLSFRAWVAVAPFLMTSGGVLGQGFPTNEQMRHYRTMDSPRLSPDGTMALVRVHDATADGGKTHLWVTPVGGGAARQLTYSPDGDKSGEGAGAWMPDGQSILFMAKRGEHRALYRLPMNGGEAKAFEMKVTPVVDESKVAGALPPVAAGKKEEDKAEALALEPSDFCVSPDGKWMAVIAEDPQTPGEKKQKDAKADANWVNHSQHGSRLYLMEMATSKVMAAGVPVDVRGASWSEDSTRLVVDVEGPNGIGEVAPANSGWVVALGDPAHAEKVVDLPGTVERVGWTRDGLSLVYTAQAKRNAPPGFVDLYAYTLATKVVTNFSDGLAGSVEGRGEPLSLADGGLLVGVGIGLEQGLMRFDGKTRERVKVPVAAVADVATNEKQSGWLYLGSGGGQQTQVFYSAGLGGEAKVLDMPRLSPEGVRSVAAKRVSWKSDALTIEGLLYLPPEAATRKVPLVVEVHGGPMGAYADNFSVFTDFLLGQGWAVLRTNPRGSSSRGAEFAAANKNDLGGGDYRDIMAGVDFVLKTEPLDGEKMALIGYSYGGEMAGFVETKTTRFKAIVSGAPVIDQNSEYGTERSSWYDQWYFGKPWEHAVDAWRQSPLAGVAKARTPFLLLQGEDDSTDPLGQSQEMYHALRQMGVKVDLVVYPRVDHGPLATAIYGGPSAEPWHGFDARQRIVGFLKGTFGE
jgi:dipeptidyl aminopeptidase/acylaminoacyl peptidase